MRPKNVGFSPPLPRNFCCFLPFVDRENKQLLWQTPLPRCTIPSFLILKLNSRTEIFLARIHLVPSEINWVHPFVGQLPNLIKSILQQKIFCQQNNNFVKSICFPLAEDQIFLFSRRRRNVLFKVSLIDLQSYIFSKTVKLYFLKPDNKYFSFCYTITPHFDRLNPTPHPLFETLFMKFIFFRPAPIV